MRGKIAEGNIHRESVQPLLHYPSLDLNLFSVPFQDVYDVNEEKAANDAEMLDAAEGT